ncbi:ArsR family transcriptional regulator [Aquiflexum sp. TKW24L]|uniref:ArsR family transcriptional regulator n=1 Tax=Aquiflexum sp. TKW24L TaxID=2942212 RepID=UPI0020BF9B88|nr:ArsR family transcriptional regulator [Aquiflexum sp. TKW24L]MCL6260003.1 ArsR family transcriptional regulator [Aquiflexum sp. TKW24L]
MLDNLITSKTRLKLLVKFFSNVNNQGHLRGLADEFGESTNSIRKELNNLSHAGFLVKVAEKNRIEYQANPHHPLFSNLQDIIRNYLGFDRLVEAVLERMGEVNEVILTGDYAQGIDSGTIEVMIKGEALNESYLEHLTGRIEELIERKVKFKVNQEIDSKDCLTLFKK